MAQSGTELISQNPDGFSAEGRSGGPAVSRDGRFIFFFSDASNLVPSDRNLRRDVFVRDRQAGKSERISIGFDANEANGDSQTGGLSVATSSDGRFVAFSSRASNLVPDDTNGAEDVFVFDRTLRITHRVSRGTSGEANGASAAADISADGRYVVFQSFASNLTDEDSNEASDIFRFDRETGITSRVSVASDGTEANASSVTPSMSGDGRTVAFSSGATNLVTGDTNGTNDIFLHDTDSGITSRASLSSAGVQGNAKSFLPDLSFDGGATAFKSDAFNLVPDDTNGRTDVFVYSLASGQTVRASVDSFGNESNGLSGAPTVSGDGRYVVFPSFASNLAGDDGNAVADIFVFDRQAERDDGSFGHLRRVTLDSGIFNRPPGNVSELAPALSGDGRTVAFVSSAENVVANDINNQPDVFTACNPFDSTDCAPLPPCVGDCNGDGRVAVNELVRMVGVGLEMFRCADDAESACLGGDADCSCSITVDEIVRAVGNALTGCDDFGDCSLDVLAQCLTDAPCKILP